MRNPPRRETCRLIRYDECVDRWYAMKRAIWPGEVFTGWFIHGGRCSEEMIFVPRLEFCEACEYLVVAENDAIKQWK